MDALGYRVDTVDAFGAASFALRELARTSCFQQMTSLARQAGTSAFGGCFSLAVAPLKGAGHAESRARTADVSVSAAIALDLAGTTFSTSVGGFLG